MKQISTILLTACVVQILAACGGVDTQTASDEQFFSFAAINELAEREFQESLKRPAYANFQGRGGESTVRIGVVRLDEIPAYQGSVSTLKVTASHKALLDTIAASEGTSKKQLCGDRGGYNVAFTEQCIQSFLAHPDRVFKSSGYSSAAAGRYQFMPNTWQENVVGFIRDLWQGKVGQAFERWAPFGPRSQDSAAAILIKHKRGDTGAWEALATVKPGADGKWKVPQFNTFKSVLAKLAPEWASLPNLAGRSAYGQPVHPAGYLWEVYKAAYPIYSEANDDRADGDVGSSSDAVSWQPYAEDQDFSHVEAEAEGEGQELGYTPVPGSSMMLSLSSENVPLQADVSLSPRF